MPQVREDDQRAEVRAPSEEMRHRSQEQGPHSGPPRELLDEDLNKAGRMERGATMNARPSFASYATLAVATSDSLNIQAVWKSGPQKIITNNHQSYGDIQPKCI